MKKNLFFAALAVVALASCSKVEVIDQNPSVQTPIGFSTYTAGNTKASEQTLSSVQNTGITVYANNGATAFMEAQAVTYSNSAWSYTPIKYWPNDEANNKLDFYAVQTGLANATVSATSNVPSIAFVVNDVVASQTDLLWTAPTMQQVYSGTTDGYVNFAFKHALSRIGFKACTTVDYSTNAEIKITSITFTGKPNISGTLSPAATEISSAWTSKTAAAEDKTYTPTVTTTALTTDSVLQHGDNGYIMIIPTEAKDYTVHVTYTVKAGGITTTNNKDITLSSQAFAVGKAYTVNLKVSLKDIKFSVTSVDGWDVQDALDVAVN